MPNLPHERRAAIEMDMLEKETKRLLPLLSEDEKEEKKRELAQRAGTIIKRETQMLKEEDAQAVLHIPHASMVIPDHIRSAFLTSDDELNHELQRMTDRYTDELFALPDEFATTIRFPVSRLVVDPERFMEDSEEPMAKIGMGVIYTRTSEGRTLRLKPTEKERNGLLGWYYKQHHDALKWATTRILERQGVCLIIDAHSFSSKPLPHEPDQSPDRPDICIGTDPFHTPHMLSMVAAEAFQKCGFSVAIDRPFQGALVPMKYYRKEKRVFSVMIEVRRDLYMDEESGRKNDRFPIIRSHIESALFSILECFPMIPPEKLKKLLKMSEEALEYARKVGLLPPKKEEAAEADEELAHSFREHAGDLLKCSEAMTEVAAAFNHANVKTNEKIDKKIKPYLQLRTWSEGMICGSVVALLLIALAQLGILQELIRRLIVT
ncbi:MAG: N-formylglutamate amidohydrolase [Candidatus Peregrinibacteria bacterium]